MTVLGLGGISNSIDLLQNRIYRLPAQIACEQATLITENIAGYNGGDLVGALSVYAGRIESVLRAIAHRYTIDWTGQAIDLHTQVCELERLIQVTRRMENVIRNFLNSEEGQVKWNKGDVVLLDRSASIASECAALTALAEHIQWTQDKLRSQLDAENTAMITPLLQGSFDELRLLSIIGQYMD